MLYFQQKGNSKGVRATKSYVGNFNLAFAWLFAVRGKSKRVRSESFKMQ
jgi:hypothetical protein